MTQKMKERVRIHQVIPAFPGTRAVVQIQTENGPIREVEPLLLLALVEDLVDGGNRFVVPMEAHGHGLYMCDIDSKIIIEVLAPGEDPKPWMMDVEA